LFRTKLIGVAVIANIIAAVFAGPFLVHTLEMIIIFRYYVFL
jgi:hypothetical protein